MITNDKFCMSRNGKLELSWWRRPLRLRESSANQVLYTHGEKKAHQGGNTYETKMEAASRISRAGGRSETMGPSISETPNVGSKFGTRSRSNTKGGSQ